MTAIRNATIACIRSFRLLAAALEGGDVVHRNLIDPASLEDEYGRFRVWSGNIGAQQKGHSSLDYRLRDSPLLQSNVLKLLQELETNLNEALAVVSGARLPYEQQAGSEDFSDDNASDDSEDGDNDSEEERPRYELQQRLFEVIDVINNLYRLSIRIRSPTTRTRSLKAAAYRQIDPDTGVDVFTQYANYDKRYTEDALDQLRTGLPTRKDEDVSFLVGRLSKAITKRRQQFKYWKKHRDKLANSSTTEEMTSLTVKDSGPQQQAATISPETPIHVSDAVKINLRAPPSEMQPRTLLSGTEATAHHRTLDDAVDSQSVTSVATTAVDLGGHGIDLPPPPSSADGEKDFECPYCFVICPARYSRARSWKTHLLQDLQPYVCTYKDCHDADQLFRSRREWLEHESSAHRKVWRCPSHPDSVYSSQDGLRHHLEDFHGNDITEVQMTRLVSIAETSTIDLREYCPICFVNIEAPGIAGNLHNHIANHLERLASFALPKFAGSDDDKSGASVAASNGTGSSSERSQAASSHWSLDTATNNDERWRPDSISADLGVSFTAYDMMNRLISLLGSIGLSTKPGSLSEEDWLKVRPSLRSSFPQPEVSQAFILLDDMFRRSRGDHMDLETVYAAFHRSLPSKSEPPSVSERPTQSRQGGVTLGSLYPQIGKARTEAWSTYLLCKDLSGSSTRLRDDVFTVYSNLSILAHHSDPTGSILAENVSQAMQGAMDTLIEIQMKLSKTNPTEEESAQFLSRKLAVWTWRIDALVANVKPSQGAGDTQWPGLSADAVQSVPDASKVKLERFIENTQGGGPAPDMDVTKAAPEAGLNTFEIYSADLPTEMLKKEPLSEKEEISDRPYTVRVSNLPTESNEKEGFASVLSALGHQGFHLDPEDESRGHARFKSLEDAQRVLSAFDTLQYPGLRLEIENSDEDQEDKTVLSRSDQLVGFDVEGFLEVLNRVLGKPEYRDMITWAENGHTFRILDEEAFAREVLPLFALETFSSFKERLITCGFRQQFDQQFRLSDGSSEVKRTSTWFHQHFRRGNSALRSRIPFFTKLKVRFEQTKGQPLASQIKNVSGAVDEVFFRETRSRYALKTVSDIPSISELYLNGRLQNPIPRIMDSDPPLPKEEINQKISMLQHDITMLDVDAIVNGTTPGLNAGASDSISYWIHQAAGPKLLQECKGLALCEMGKAVMTNAHNLPCRKIIHTVRPHYFQAATFTGHEDLLASCYRSCLKLAAESGLKSIAFPCLSAGGFGFPSREAAEVALKTTRAFLESGEGDTLEKVVFCVYKDLDRAVYTALIPQIFPPSKTNFGFQAERVVREESPDDYDDDGTPNQETQEGVFDLELGAAGPSNPTRPNPARLNNSVESLSRLTGGPSLWACCRCRARPMETPNCLVCYHELCSTCEGESANNKAPNLFLVYLHPSANMLESSDESGLTSLDRRDLIGQENQVRGTVRSRPNSPTRNYKPTYVKAHRRHLSLDTLFYYDLPFEFDNDDHDHIIIQRELSEEQALALFEHSRRHRRNLPSIIRTRTHPNPMSSLPTIRIGSHPTFSKQDRPAGAPIFLPEPFVTADHCDFYIEAERQLWMLEINRSSGATFLNGRRLVRLPVPDDHDDHALPAHDSRGYVVRSGDVLGLGEDDDGKPVYLFRVELDGVATADDALWDEAEARASRYGFPTIGLDSPPLSSAADDDADDADVDPDVASGYKIIDAPAGTAGATRWTKLDRRLVNPDALKEAGLHYENRVRYLLVFRELAAGEVAQLAQRTREGREVKAATEFTRKERRRKERRARQQKAQARDRKRGEMGA